MIIRYVVTLFPLKSLLCLFEVFSIVNISELQKTWDNARSQTIKITRDFATQKQSLLTFKRNVILSTYTY